jgi:adenylate cyclase class IV
MTFEVEQKWRVAEGDFGALASMLFDMWFSAFPCRQQDTYLDLRRKGSRRVRKEVRADETVHFFTAKRKCHQAPGTNHERERRVDAGFYERAVTFRTLHACGSPVLVNKRRIHFVGEFGGYNVTVCLDHVDGPNGLSLGHFVELETMVHAHQDIEEADRALDSLAAKLLPLDAKRERRGYKSLVLDALSARCGGRHQDCDKCRSKSKKKKKGAKKSAKKG